MRICKICGASETSTRIITSKGIEYCGRCYQRRNNITYPLPNKGEIGYSPEGLPICHICGEAHNKLLSHVRLVHSMTALEYKKEFGLDLHKGIMSGKSTDLARQRANEHMDVIRENLVVKGAKFRFKRGHKGRTKEQVSLQSYKRLQLSKIIKRREEN